MITRTAAGCLTNLAVDHAHLLPELSVVYCGCGLGGGVFLILHITARLLDHIKAVGEERRGGEGRGRGRGEVMRISCSLLYSS